MRMETLLHVFVVLIATAIVSCNLITKGPESQTLDKGSNATLTCQTSVPSKVIWQFQSKDVDTNETRLSMDTNNNLIIIKLTFKDAGNYTCVVVNASGIIIEKSTPGLLIVNFIKPDPQIPVQNTSVYIGDRTVTLYYNAVSFPEYQNVTFYNGDKPLQSYTKVTNYTYKLPLSFYSSYQLIFSALNKGDFGAYYVEYNWQGQKYRDHFVNLQLREECRSGEKKCPSINKCLYRSQLCNNIDDCGDLWDEKQNCPLPPALEFYNVKHHQYTELKIFYYTKDSVNRTTVVKLYIAGKLVQEELTIKTRTYIQIAKVDGIQNNVTYNISLQSKSITGNLSIPVFRYFTVPLKALPSVPGVSQIRHHDYNSIRIYMNAYTDKDVTYNTTFQIADQDGNKVANDVTLQNSQLFAILGDGNLQNGTSYLITITSSNFLGESPNPLVVNYTIPRKVAPGPVQKLRMQVVSRLNKIWVRIKFDLPSDMGGSTFIRGEMKLCQFTPPNTYKKCETRSLIASESTKEYSKSFYSLVENTRYSVEVSYKSDANQEGPKSILIFTTPSEESFTSSGLGTGTIVGIVFACCSAVFAIIGAICKTMTRSSSAGMGAGTVTYSKP